MHPSVATGIPGRSTPSLSRSAEEQATSRELKRLQHELQAMREQVRYSRYFMCFLLPSRSSSF
ncbi:unnamed protein product [Dibothriocephalus latus]|uniref:Uncharacterized protein n=1 Tax=Dibothriocephalus latus TaxID=60516 RepID=A0A3P7LU03_DIBLA|nr:unnamed protein product [Dibothriocephalus latus]